jgi:F-type H+-transporting ATPase subunit delta
MSNPRLASRYAKSILDLAIEQNQQDAVLGDMQLLVNICRQNRDFEVMLESPVIKGDKKGHVMKAVLGDRISALSNSFITLLLNKGREGNLPEIASAYVSQYKEMKRIKTVKLISAAPLNDAVKAQIRQKLKSALPDYQLELEESIDPSLIGGYVLDLGDKVVDASIRRDLNDVKKQFMENLYIQKYS